LKWDENDIVKFIEPVFHFCNKRLNNRFDAEDLASEIMVHILNGIGKYQIDSLENWVWRIAHNRYARFINLHNKRNEILSDFDFTQIIDDYEFIDKLIIIDEYQQIFKYLHTLSSEYRDIFVDYYIEQIPVKQIAKKYSITEATVKWRLNISRKKIRSRIGEGKMDKIYKRKNWIIQICNGGFFDPNKYLNSQIARAICDAAYEKSLTVEEISLKTGIPAMYIEDEIPRLINGDAIVKEGNKYVTNFIIISMSNKKKIAGKFTSFISNISDYFMELFNDKNINLSEIGFYAPEFSLKKIGFIVLPAILRGKINKIKNGLNIKDDPLPPRLDGGFGWFIANEVENENEYIDIINNGYYISGNITGDAKDLIYYFVLNNYKRVDYEITNWLHDNIKITNIENGILSDNFLSDDDKVNLIKNNLIVKDENKYKINYCIFKREQYDNLIESFKKTNTKLDDMLTEIIIDIYKNFKLSAPKRLDSQINNFVSGYVQNIIGFIAEELINRNVLNKPDNEKPLTDGVFCILGEYLGV